MTLHYPRENVKFAVGQVRGGDSNYCRNGYLYSHTSLKNIILKLSKKFHKLALQFGIINKKIFSKDSFIPFILWNVRDGWHQYVAA